MYKYIAWLFLALIPFQSIQTQTIERSLSEGFVTTSEIIKPFDDDKWLLAGRGEPEPGAYFHDRLFVAVIGFDGQIHLRKNLSIPLEEVHYWHDVLALPDGGILASFESTLCDVGGYKINIQRLNAQGSLMWQKTGGFSIGDPRPPEQWFIAPDGNLIGAGFDRIWKVDVNSGDILWKAELQGVNAGLANPYYFLPVTGTEDFYAVGTPDFQRWKKSGDPLTPVYVLENSVEVPGYRNRIVASPLGGFYCVQHFPDEQIEWVNADLDFEVLPITVDVHQIAGMTSSNSGFYLAESSDNFSNRLRRFDFLGQNQVELQAPNKWFGSRALVAHNGWLAMAGNDRSGEEFQGTSFKQCTAAWLRTFPENSPNPVTTTPNVAVSEIKQLHTISTTSFPAFPSGYIYDLHGGDFQVKISNLGDFPIEQVSINTVFDYNQNFDVCFNISAKQKRFSGLSLAPGASVWLDFGDIDAYGQANLPPDICFWTSSPNEQPDIAHENDRACIPAGYVVGVNDPEMQQVVISPNPADDFTDVSFAESVQGEKWQIFDATGRLVTMGVCENSEKLRLETGGFSNGLYFVRVKNRVVKLLVQH